MSVQSEHIIVLILFSSIVVYTLALFFDLNALRQTLRELRQRGRRSIGHSPLSMRTTLGWKIAEELLALQYQLESAAWELEVATRDIARRSHPDDSTQSLGTSARVELQDLLRRIATDFRHEALVILGSDGFKHSQGRLSRHFHGAFSLCFDRTLRGEAVPPLTKGVFEAFGFCEHLADSFDIEGTKYIVWLGYTYERPPTDSERKRFALLVHELSMAIAVSYERRALTQRATAAELTSQSHSKLIAEVSHDIRSPLSNLKAILNVLRLEGLSSDSPQLVDVAMNNCDAMDEIVGALIDLSRVQSGTLSAKQELFDPLPLIESVVRSFQVTARVKKIELRTHIENEIPYVRIDRSHLRRVLTNLLSNSFKYTEHGSVEMHVGSGANGALTIKVVDTGRGMTDAQVAGLFTPFTRFHSEMADGIGLGLTLTRSLVEINAGSILVESKVGKGSIFTIMFPAAQTSRKVDPHIIDSVKVPLAAPRLLLVDDDRDCVDTLERALRSSFYVRKAYGVEEAIRWLKGGEIDMVVSDARMPGGGAEAILQHVLRTCPSIPVVVLSGDLSEEMQLRQQGARKVLQKPADVPTLVASLLELDQERSATKAA